MRLRYVSVTYSFGGSSPSLERHYRELREAMLHPAQHYSGLQPATWRPPLDIHETEHAITVKAELAGMREEAIDIALYENALVISGQRDDDSDHDETAYYHEAQVRYGPFRAEIALPMPVERDAAAATYENGFLRVRLPKALSSSNQGERAGTGRAPQAGAQGGHQLASIPIITAQTLPAGAPRAQAESTTPLAGEQ